MKLKELEALVLTHLQESGEIRADLKWLKKSYWVIAGGVVVEMMLRMFR